MCLKRRWVCACCTSTASLGRLAERVGSWLSAYCCRRAVRGSRGTPRGSFCFPLWEDKRKFPRGMSAFLFFMLAEKGPPDKSNPFSKIHISWFLCSLTKRFFFFVKRALGVRQSGRPVLFYLPRQWGRMGNVSRLTLFVGELFGGSVFDPPHLNRPVIRFIALHSFLHID